MTDSRVIRIEGISKRFCRSFRRSMLYAGYDLARTAAGLPLRTDTLRKDEFWALDGVTFDVKQGECLGLIGPNGSGKSTLLRILNGIIDPDRGVARVRGNVGAMIQVGAGFHPKLTGRENIYVAGAIRGMSKREIDDKFDQIVEFAGVGEFIDMPVMFYSSGMFVRLGYAVAAHIDPDILLMDEILSVGDVGFRHKCLNHMERKLAGGCTLVLVTHSMSALVTICSRVVVLAKGRVVYDGDVDGGIAAYERTLATQEPEVGGMEGLDPRVTLEDVQVRSADGSDRVQTGEGVDVRIRLACRETVGPLKVEFRIQSEAYGVVAVTDSGAMGGTIPGTEGTRDVVVTIPCFPFLPGLYRVRLNVYEQGTGRTFIRRQAGSGIRVVGRGRAYAEAKRLVALRESWRVEDRP